MADVRAANKAIDGHWFDRATMRFFQTRIESTVYKNGTFITSEQSPHGSRKFSVRRAMADGRIDTVGEFQGYRTKEAAREAARRVWK
jgi:hypothetical protein